ncbi:Marc2 [Acrasis kona]|uniref:Marc2 n=1 Tax=Acrasis kona TaxID=1008807 RepID=A0AAW2YS97_9EUKA
MTMITITDINIFPLKSCKGFTVKSWPYTDKGFKFDREWMLISVKRNCQITQREYPKMSLIEASLTESLEYLIIKTPDNPLELRIPTKLPDYPKMDTVVLFGNEVNAVDMGDEAADHLSAFLNYKVRLMKTPDDHVRKPAQELFDDSMNDVVTKTVFNNDKSLVAPILNSSFADNFPFLVIADISLEDLNKKATDQIEMLRFRPNIVVTGTKQPFEEDTWHFIEINGENKSGFYCATCCDRCTIPNVNPSKGVKDVDVRVVLSSFRRNNKNQPLFGVYLLCTSKEGTISVGDTIQVVKSKDPPQLISA